MNTIKGSAQYAGLLPVELSDDPTPVRPTTLENEPLRQPRPGQRALPGLTRFLMTFCIGVATTLAWQSYGDAARQMLANSYPHFGWFGPRGALTAQKAPDTIALAASPALYPDHQRFDAMLRDFRAMSQSIERIAASQEQITRAIDQIAKSIAAGQEQMTRSTDQTATGQEQMTRTTDQSSTSVGQASSADPGSITVEDRADRASSQPTVRSDIKPREARPPQTLPERKLVSVGGGHDPSCLPSASAVLQNHPGGRPSWTLKAPGHEGAICWYASARPRARDRRREITPGEKETIGTVDNPLSQPPASYTRAPE